jgi:hypothetical protein
MSTVSLTSTGTISATSTNSYYLNSGADLVINHGATLNSSSPPDITWNEKAAGGVTIVNDGVIIASGDKKRVFDTAQKTKTASAPSNFILDNNGTIIAGGDVMRDQYVNDGGTIMITNTGFIEAGTTLDSGAVSGRGFNIQQDTATIASGTPSFSLLSINNSGILLTSDDSIRLTTQNPAANAVSGAYNPLISGDAFITNSGTILSAGSLTAGGATGADSGQAIDFADVNANSGQVVITNLAGGLIEATDNDAIRPGNNGIVINYGTIIGGQVFTAADEANPDQQGSNAAISATYDELITVTNYGLIEGSKSGVYGERDPATETLSSDGAPGAPALSSDIIVNNEAGGVIIGQDGKGVGADYGNIYNAGTIIGADNASLLRGDGDGIDVNFTVYVTNASGGLIEALGSEGSDDNGRTNVADGLAIGGGTVYNAGTIISANNGVTVNNDGNPDGSRSGNADLVLTNAASGVIDGENGYAIRSENKAGTDEGPASATDYDTVTNYGTIISGGSIPDFSGTFEITTYTSTTVAGVITYGTIETPDPNVNGVIEGVTYTGAADAGSIRFTQGDGSAIQLGEGNDVLNEYGIITATDGLAVNLEGGKNTLNLYAGATISGMIDGGIGGTNILNLGIPGGNTLSNTPNATAGTLDQIIDFATLNVNAGSWTLEDSESYASVVSIASGASLNIAGTGDLVLGSLASVTGLITASPGGAVDFTGLTFSGTEFGTIGAGGILDVTENGVTEILTLASSLSGESVAFANDGAGGTKVFLGNAASIVTGYATVQNNGSISNPVIAGGTLELGSGATVTGDINFTGNNGRLIIDGETSIPNTITGFGPGDSIELQGVPYVASEDSFTVASPGIVTIDADGTYYQLNIDGAYVGETNFSLGGDLVLEEDVACYATGTRIATARGEVAVEDLNIGDEVKTLHAGMQKIKWIGTRSYASPFANKNHMVLPILIRQSAIDAGVPMRDLYVSPGHAICIDDTLVHAMRLVNGVSIVQLEHVESVTYFHVELENHEIIFAENCPAETFMDENFRRQFQNAEDFHARYPAHTATQMACLPRHDSGYTLNAIRRRLAARAGIQPDANPGQLQGFIDTTGPKTCAGWAMNFNMEMPVYLDIYAGESRLGRVLANIFREDVRGVFGGTGNHGFEFHLPAEFSGEISVRRAADGACLQMAQVECVRAA